MRISHIICLILPTMLLAANCPAQEGGLSADSLVGKEATIKADSLVLTIGDAQRRFLKSNLGILAARYHLTSGEADLVAAELLPNPQFSFNGTYLGVFSKPVNYSTTQTSYRIDQVLDVFGKRGRRVDMAEHSVASARADFTSTVFQAVRDFKESFITLTFAQKLYGLAESRYDIFRRAVVVAQARFSTGDISESELMKLRLTELDYRQSLNDAQMALVDAQANFRQSLNLSPGTIVRAVYDFQPRFSIPPEDSLVTVALSHRADMISQREKTSMQESRVTLAKRNALPDLSVGIELDRQGPEFGNTLGGGISIALPLFNRNQDEVQRAEADYDAARLDERVRENAIVNGIHAAYAKYVSSLRLVQSLSDATMKNAEEVRGMAIKGYTSGQLSLIDFLETERIYNDAVQSYLNALSRFAINQVELERATGVPLFEEESQ